MKRRFWAILACCFGALSLFVGLPIAGAEPIFLKTCANSDPVVSYRTRLDQDDPSCTLPKISAAETYDPRIAVPASAQTAIAMATEEPNLQGSRRLALSFKTGTFNGQSAIGLSGLYVVERDGETFHEIDLFANAGTSLNDQNLMSRLGFRVKW